ncbi:hypothetical protein C8F01DRAFT_1166153, partial [Mycena amicta]
LRVHCSSSGSHIPRRLASKESVLADRIRSRVKTVVASQSGSSSVVHRGGSRSLKRRLRRVLSLRSCIDTSNKTHPQKPKTVAGSTRRPSAHPRPCPCPPDSSFGPLARGQPWPRTTILVVGSPFFGRASMSWESGGRRKVILGSSESTGIAMDWLSPRGAALV